MKPTRKARRVIEVHGPFGRARRLARERRNAGYLPTNVAYGKTFHADGTVTVLRFIPTGRREFAALMKAREVLVVRTSAAGGNRAERRETKARDRLTNRAAKKAAKRAATP